MIKYSGNLIGSSFNSEVTRIMNEKKGSVYMSCANCPHHNGECDMWARQGKCRMYNFYSTKFRKPVIRKDLCLDNVTPEYNNGWILVSERLPEYDKKYFKNWEEDREHIVTIGNSSMSTTLCFAEDGSWYDGTDGNVYSVTAWMPLPESYKFSGGKKMNRTSELLLEVVERFMFYLSQEESENPFVDEMAGQMVDISIYEMWMLTQK